MVLRAIGIVNTPEMLNPRIVGAGDYRFQKLFSEGEYIAAGVLVIPKGAQKPNKKTDQSTMVSPFDSRGGAIPRLISSRSADILRDIRRSRSSSS